MARQLTPLGRFLFVLSGLSLLGYGLYRYGVLARVGHRARAREGRRARSRKDDFGRRRRRRTASATSAGARAGAPIGGGTRLNRPIRVAIVLWGGYAGGIMANGGMLPNKDSVFSRTSASQVELLQIDDFEKSRDAFRAGGDKGGVDIMWSTVDAYALEYGGLLQAQPEGDPAVRLEPRRRRHRGGRLHQERRRPAGQDAWPAREETPSHYFALYVLTQGGLTNRDVNWVFTDSAVEAANVFKAGKVDAAVSWSPDVYVAARERQGGHILASTKEASNLIADIFVARGDFVEQHPEDVRRFVAGWLKGVEMVKKNPDKAAVLLQKSLTGVNTLEDAKAMLDDVKLPDYAENRAFFDPQGSLVNYYTHLPDGPGHLAQDRQDQGRLPAAPDGGHALPRGRRRVLPARRHGRRGPSRSSTSRRRPSQQRAAILTKTVSIYFPTGSSTSTRTPRPCSTRRSSTWRPPSAAPTCASPATPTTWAAATRTCRLSRARADAVARYLVSKGFEREQVRRGRQRARQAGGQQRHRRRPRQEPAHRLRGHPR